MPQIVSNFVEVFVYRIDAERLPEYLLLKRSENVTLPNIWQVITGTIDENEKAFETALRELNEEAGLEPVNFFASPFVNNFYRHDTDSIYLAPIFIAEVDNGDVKISNEHSKFKWCNKDEAVDLIYWYNQKEHLINIDKHLTDKELFLTISETKRIKL